MSTLAHEHCQPQVGRLNSTDAQSLLEQIGEWELTGQDTLSRLFRFSNFYETIAFVNAVAWIANQQDHHPDLEVSYNSCRINYSTHSVGGLSRNDFVCAARIDTLIE